MIDCGKRGKRCDETPGGYVDKCWLRYLFARRRECAELDGEPVSRRALAAVACIFAVAVLVVCGTRFVIDA